MNSGTQLNLLDTLNISYIPIKISSCFCGHCNESCVYQDLLNDNMNILSQLYILDCMYLLL